MLRLNVGCGDTPTPGWKNYDNSLSLRLARRPICAKICGKLGLLDRHQMNYISFARNSDIHFADVTRRIPEADATVNAIATSHMLEHIAKDRVTQFLKEARRVLVSGGVLRISVPNIRFLAEDYIRHGDADAFISSTHLTRPSNNTMIDKLKYLWVGDRHHVWMYDGPSLCKVLLAAGFQNPQVMEPGTTTIPDPGELNLRQREQGSVFVEASNP